MALVSALQQVLGAIIAGQALREPWVPLAAHARENRPINQLASPQRADAGCRKFLRVGELTQHAKPVARLCRSAVNQDDHSRDQHMGRRHAPIKRLDSRMNRRDCSRAPPAG